jgi:hypothetical protein
MSRFPDVTNSRQAHQHFNQLASKAGHTAALHPSYFGFAMDSQESRQPESRPQESRDGATPGGRFLSGLAAIGIGLLLVLFGLGLIPVKPTDSDAPLWLTAVAGLAFLLAGISIAVGARNGVSETGELPKDASRRMQLFHYLIAVAIAGALASIATWIAFGAGPRAFGGTGMALLSPEANAMTGRIVFGIGAVLAWLITIAIAISGLRKLLSGKTG